MNSKAFRRLFSWGILLISIVLMGWYFSNNKDSLAALRDISLTDLLIISSIQLLHLLVYAMRMQLIIEKCSGKTLSTSIWARIFILARFFNSVFPQSGNFYRGVELKKHFKVEYTKYIAAFISLIWMVNIFNVAVSVALLLWYSPTMLLGGVPVWFEMLILLGCIISMPLIGNTILRRLRLSSLKLIWVQEKISAVLEVTLNNAKQPAYIAKISAYSLALLAASTLSFYFAFRAVGTQVDVSVSALFVAVQQLGGFFAITPNNIGIQEVVLGILGENIGIGAGESIIASALLRTISTFVLFASALPLGGLGLLASVKTLKEDAQSETKSTDDEVT